MGIRNALRLAAAAPAPVALSAAPVEPAPVASPGRLSIESLTRAERVAQDLALAIPSVRKAQHVIAGTIGTFALHATDATGARVDPADRPDLAWLKQPSATRSRSWTITRTVQDLIWRDRAVWRITDRAVYGTPRTFERVHPHRISTTPDPLDPDAVASWVIDSTEVDPAQLVIFDGAGLGGLDRYGYELLTIYGQLQAAAGRYARAPQPYAILKNTGEDLDEEEIDALLEKWESARGNRSIGYTNDVIEYAPQQGYSARELQLTEAREHAALEVARLFALPAFALDASPAGSSLTYGNVVDRRRDLVEALRPWMTVITDALSLDDRRGRTSGTVLPRGMMAGFDADAYTRDDPQTRMATWSTALAAGVLTIDEVRANEPLTRN